MTLNLKIKPTLFALICSIIGVLATFGNLTKGEGISLEERVEQLERENRALRDAVNDLSSFTGYKKNYALFYSTASTDENRSTPSEDAEVKFQISLKQRLVSGEWGTTFFGYTQKSFWRMYDGEDSRPFRETNYNPELFYRSPKFTAYLPLTVLIGLEHESNGAREPESKSWNRVYITPVTHLKLSPLDALKIKLKVWGRIPEKEKDDPDDPYGDENPDIATYYGNKELTFEVEKGGYSLSLMFRWNMRSGHGAQQVDLSLPITAGPSLKWYVQYWNGYGESLIDYNRHLTRFGFGVRLHQ